MTSPVARAKTGASQLTDLARTGGFLPSGKVIENFRRDFGTSSLAPTSGTLRMCGGFLIPAGRTISTITCYSGGTALASGSNQWFALFNAQTLAKLAVTNDDTSTAWGTNAAKTLTLASAYTPTADIEVYVGIVIVAATVPSLICTASGGNATLLAVVPATSGNSTAGLTNPASCPDPAAAITGSTNIYATLA